MRIAFIITLFFLALPLLFADVGIGSFYFKGQITAGEKPLPDQDIKIVFHFRHRKPNTLDMQTIRTNSKGEYSLKIEWWTPCTSSRFPDCKGLSREECIRMHAKDQNPDSIGFVLANKERKIYNPFWEVFKKSGERDTTLVRDVRF